MSRPTRDIMLFGTVETVTAPVLLSAGPLSAELEDGNLRYVRYHGAEMLRAISFIVRDKNWGTYRPVIDKLHVMQHADRFSVSYKAVAGDAAQRFVYAVRISGSADGSLTFEGEGTAEGELRTNRTGFVVLHPITGVSGNPCTIEYCDGRIQTGQFPQLIDPVQPMMNLRALTHEFAPGFKVTCKMEGDTFEMEDQRNWADASYKTYVRPLARPWPYTLASGERVAQRIELTVDAVPGAVIARQAGPAVLSLQTTQGAVPPLGFGLDPHDAAQTRQVSGVLRHAAPRHVVISFDYGRGHDAATLEEAVATGRMLSAELWLEAVVRNVDAFEEEIAGLGQLVSRLGSPFKTLLISPAADLQCTLPGSVWPPCPDLNEIYCAARKAFPGVRLGGGMFSFFTELNRKRPPLANLDLVSFTTIALMHAGDDRSATEGLESLPAIAASVCSFIDGKPFHVGPSAIGMRANPYGEAPMANPNNLRQAMNRMDPRQRGLFAAAWTVGYFAHFAKHGAAALTLGGGAGDFGLVHTQERHIAKPWYDEHGGLYPAFHVFKGLSALAGRPALAAECTCPREIQATGAMVQGKAELWVANLTDRPQSLTLPASRFDHMSVLDEKAFLVAANRVDFFAENEKPLATQTLNLTPYAVIRLRG